MDQRAVVVDETRRRSWCRRCRLQGWDRSSVPVGVVGLPGIAGVLIARGQLDERGAPGVQPQPERATPGRCAQVFGDARGVGEARRIARLVGRDRVVGDIEARRSRSRTTPAPADRTAPTPPRCRSRAAPPYPAARRPRTAHHRRSARVPRPRRPPRVRSRAPGSANGAAAAPRWCRVAATTTRPATPAAALRAHRPRRPTPAPRRPSPRSSHRHLDRRRVHQLPGARDPDQRPPFAGFHPDRRRDVEAEFGRAASRPSRPPTPRARSTPMSPTG